MRDFAKSLGILVLGGREGGFGAKMETFLPFSLFEVPVLFVAPKRQKNHFDLGDTLFIPEKRHRSHLSSKGTEFNFDILSPFCTLALPAHG